MYRMAVYQDYKGISRLLDEGVDPAAPEECREVRWVVVCAPSLMASASGR
jgi:hypothetical protein